MTKNETPSTPRVTPKATAGVEKSASQKLELGTPGIAGYRGQKADRPGFDLDGSTGETHAGTGLGLGEDAFDTPGERRLPGRQLDNNLTIPRWSGPEPRNAGASGKKTEVAKGSPVASKKKDH
jgi:hypothetical protein